MKGLNEQELNSYLAEINNQEATELPKDLLSDKAWVEEITKDENGICHKKTSLTEAVYSGKRDKSLQVRQENANTRKQRRKKIIQDAIENSYIDLNTLLTIEQVKMLIYHESCKYTDKMKCIEACINKSFYNYVYYKLPKAIRFCWEQYPEIIIPLEPFIYQASEDFGKGYQFKVDISVPSYYSSERIIDMMQTNNPNILITIDKCIVNFYKYKEARNHAENKLANSLINIKTFYQLLKKDPFLYETLINIIKKENNNETD